MKASLSLSKLLWVCFVECYRMLCDLLQVPVQGQQGAPKAAPGFKSKASLVANEGRHQPCSRRNEAKSHGRKNWCIITLAVKVSGAASSALCTRMRIALSLIHRGVQLLR